MTPYCILYKTEANKSTMTQKEVNVINIYSITLNNGDADVFVY